MYMALETIVADGFEYLTKVVEKRVPIHRKSCDPSYITEKDKMEPRSTRGSPRMIIKQALVGSDGRGM